MIRIAGVTLPDNKRIDIALTLIYGIGRNNVVDILNKAQISSNKRVKEITSDEISKLQTLIESDYKVEGDLRKDITDNIKRLKAIGSYRGIRHTRNLPVRGQRTRSNARTKRGKRVTIGALKKETRVKLQSSDTAGEAKEGAAK
ncbi:30S ribosomal protein S13 [Candidatus Gottesmanbacteria bacterium]|nr:30S ribosomal protein S13 [Candidatus Gottesmanbacteria bacterium]